MNWRDTAHPQGGGSEVFVEEVARRLVLRGHEVTIVSRPGAGTSQPTETHPLFDWQHAIELKQSRFGGAPAVPTHDDWGPLVIPPRTYFMMGDARYDSKDSRYWGIVPRDNVRGRPLIVYYSYRPGPSDSDTPICNPDTSDRPLPALTDIRWSRIGDRVR